jgi:Ca2+-transporting ATPase
MGEFYKLSVEDVFKTFATREEGLSGPEVEKQQKNFGKNELPHDSGFRALGFLIAQFKSPLVYILLAAGVLSIWIKEYFDALIIMMAVAVNVGVGFYQEFSSSQILSRLAEKVRVLALVRRNSELHQIDAAELVPGDIIVVRSGMKIPADARLFKTKDFFTNEALLTGESSAVKKEIEKIEKDSGVADRKNMIFMGSAVERGEGEAVVVKTGKETEIGEIAMLAKNSREEFTPLQEKIAKLGEFLTLVVLGAASIIVLLGSLEGLAFNEIFVTSVAVAVAAIPEGLPAAIAVILAVSSQEIFKNNGLVKKLLAAETLGSVTTLLTDKTGTLTEGKMKIEKILSSDEKKTLTALALANEAIFEKTDKGFEVSGEATDKAKLEAFFDKGFDLKKVLEAFPRINFLPFDSVSKLMASFHKIQNPQGNAVEIFISGAPEAVLEVASDFPGKDQIKEEVENLAQAGFRVIAAAEETLPIDPEEISRKSEDDLRKLVTSVNFLGLAAIRDPIREDVKQTVKDVRNAGIRIIMFTGDHKLTALTIGEELGFGTKAENIMEGEILDKISDEELMAIK